MMALLKKKDVTSEGEETGIDYGKVLIMFVNPANPYSWFLYMLGFIVAYGTIAGS